MLTKSVLEHYRKLRAPHISERGLYQPIQAPANACLALAKRKAFVGHIWGKLEAEGRVRIRFDVDEYAQYEDLAGDCYNVEINADSVPGGERTILAQEKDFKRQIERDGVWGFIVERKCPCCGNWEHVDSCWGFVGRPEDFADEYLWAQENAIEQALSA